MVWAFPPQKLRPWFDNPRASYRAENPTNPKIGQKYQPDIQIPPTAGDRKNTPKIPGKYPKNTNFVFFWYSGRYLKGYFGESHVLYVGGYFCTSLAFLFCSWARSCQTMVWVSPFPGTYRVWGGLGFGPNFAQTVWVSFRRSETCGRGRRASLDFFWIWAAAEGGAKRIAWIWGGGKRTAECALQNHFWRPQKLGLVWAVPLSFKGNDRESPKKGGGKRIVGGGSKNVFGGGVFRRIYGMFSPPPEFSTPLGRSLMNAGYSSFPDRCWGYLSFPDRCCNADGPVPVTSPPPIAAQHLPGALWQRHASHSATPARDASPWLSVLAEGWRGNGERGNGSENFCWDAVDLGSCPKSESSRKGSGEGAEGLLDNASKRPLARVRNRVAPVQKRVWVVQKTLGRPLLPGPKRSQKDLLHPPLTTFGDFPCLGNFPGPQHPKTSEHFSALSWPFWIRNLILKMSENPWTSPNPPRTFRAVTLLSVAPLRFYLSMIFSPLAILVIQWSSKLLPNYFEKGLVLYFFTVKSFEPEPIL